ncbi:MAG: trigger factor [Dehalococcoidia bacterium]|nr:trigger factor [Dehalococcoidia bacterium]
MKVTQEEMVDRQAVLQIELEPQEMEPFVERAYRRLVQRTTIPGFRKGKAPRSVFERLVGREALVSDAMELLVPEATAKAVQEQQLEAVGNPQVDVVQMDPAVLKATVPLKPLVDLGHYRDLRLEEESSEVTDEDLQRVMEELQRTSATWEPVDRPVGDDDLITMNVRAEVDGRVLTDQKDIPYLVSKDVDRPFPGFAGNLLDIAVEETKRFTVTLPDTYEDRRVAGKEAHFVVKVLEVKERKLPEMDDEFGKGVGVGYESLEALKEHVRQDIQAQKVRAAGERLQEQALEKVIQDSSVELPPLMVEHEVEHFIDDQQQTLARGGMSMEAYLQSAGKSPEELRAELKDQAVVALKRAWVLSQLAEEEGLEASSEEIDEEIGRLASSMGEQAKAIVDAFSSPGARDSLARAVLSRKARERLAEIARGRPSAPSAEEPTPST